MHTPKLGRSKQAKVNNSITLRDGQPAINVKVYNLQTPEGISDSESERAWERTVERFWYEATCAAHERGYSGVFAEGRSGGWCVPYLWSKGNPKHFPNGPYSQGPDVGYPYYPDVEHDSAVREKFRAFQREIRRLLSEVQANYTAGCQAIRNEEEQTRHEKW